MTAHHRFGVLWERLCRISAVQRVESDAEATSIADILAADKRSLVIYLRSFDSDLSGDGPVNTRFTRRQSRGTIKSVYNARLPASLNTLVTGARTAVRVLSVIENGVAKMSSLLGPMAQPDASLARAFSEIGPVVTMGRPLERYAPRGPLRARIQSDEWQEEIATWLKLAIVVVIRPDVSPGVVWELRTALSVCDPRRICLLFWGTDRQRYAEIKTIIAPVVELPEYSKLDRSFLGYQFHLGRNRRSLLHFGVIEGDGAIVRPISFRRGVRFLLHNEVDLDPIIDIMRRRCGVMPTPSTCRVVGGDLRTELRCYPTGR